MSVASWAYLHLTGLTQGKLHFLPFCWAPKGCLLHLWWWWGHSKVKTSAYYDLPFWKKGHKHVLQSHKPSDWDEWQQETHIMHFTCISYLQKVDWIQGRMVFHSFPSHDKHKQKVWVFYWCMPTESSFLLIGSRNVHILVWSLDKNTVIVTRKLLKLWEVCRQNCCPFLCLYHICNI